MKTKTAEPDAKGWPSFKAGFVSWAITFLILFFVIYLGINSFYVLSGKAFQQAIGAMDFFVQNNLMFYSVLFSLLFSLPFSLSIIWGRITLNSKSPRSILYKMPVCAFLSSLLVSILTPYILSLFDKISDLSGEAMLFVILLGAISLANTFINFLLALYLLKNDVRPNKKVLITLLCIIGVEILYLSISLVLISTASYCDSPLAWLTFRSKDIWEDPLASRCSSEEAINQNDFSACTTKLIGGDASLCLALFAIKTDNPQICDNTPNPFQALTGGYNRYKKQCYLMYNEKSNGKYLCTEDGDCMKKGEVICIDSDGGYNLTRGGKIVGMYTPRADMYKSDRGKYNPHLKKYQNHLISVRDTCYDNKMFEFYCNGTGVIRSDVPCPEGMICGKEADGDVCSLSSNPPVEGCVDSDGGENQFIYGTVTSISKNYGTVEIKDSCDILLNGVEVQREAICKNNLHAYIKNPCPDGTTCKEGVCINKND